MPRAAYHLRPISLNLAIRKKENIMGKISAILQAAQQRAKDLNLPYEGALLPTEAYELWQTAPGVKLVDVRTRAEIEWVGKVPDALDVEWLSYPGMQRNLNFIAQLEQVADRGAPVLFLCRSAHRSHAAAILATENGFQDCYNILEGFEGDKDAAGHRRTINGWCVAGLPWQQT